MINGMTSGRYGAEPRSIPRVAGRSRDGSRLRLRPAPKHMRIKRVVTKSFYWRGWKTVGALAASLVAICTVIVAVATFFVSAQTLKANTRQQLSDRFAKAIEQLGSDKLDVRLGGIYELGQLAEQSPSDHPAVFDVLTAFVREHASRDAGRCEPGFPLRPSGRRARAPVDIQTVINVIARRDRKNDRGVIDLSRTCLGGADFTNLQLRDIDIWGADLRGASFDYANLERSILAFSDLSDASFLQADLASAYLYKCKFQRALFNGANLTGADLNHVDLSDADLANLDIPATNGEVEIIGDANLSGAILTDIYYSKSTKWPSGFQPPHSRPHV